MLVCFRALDRSWCQSTRSFVEWGFGRRAPSVIGKSLYLVPLIVKDRPSGSLLI